MKNVLTIGLSIVLFSIVIFSCDVNKQLEDVKKVGYVCNNYALEPVNEMGRGEVFDMIQNYYKNQYQAIQSTVRLPNAARYDSRAVFFNLDTLKKFIYFIEQSARNYPDAVKKNLGVNVYFASYPERMHKTKTALDNFSNIVTYDYTNRHTLIFMPSICSPNGSPKDFDLNTALANAAKNIDAPLPLLAPGFFGDPTARVAAVASTNVGSQNNGTGTPPPFTTDPNNFVTTGNVILDTTGR